MRLRHLREGGGEGDDDDYADGKSRYKDTPGCKEWTNTEQIKWA